MMELDTELWASEQFRRRIAGRVERAALDGERFSVVACIPRHLPNEDGADIVQMAADSVQELVRKEDLAGRLTSEGLAVALPETGAAGARALAHRLKNNLSLRSAHLRSTLWEAGYASLPENGATPEELLRAALESAKSSRFGV